jgi:hypothetical protein
MICTQQRPLRKVALLDALVEVALVAFAVLADQRFGLGIAEVADALLTLEVELDPEALVLALIKLKV